MGFEVFDKSEIEQYKQEARQRWGNTEAYQEYMHKQLRKTDAEAEQDGKDIMLAIKEIGALRDLPPETEAVQQKVKALQQTITRNYYNCTNEILATLGEMYADSERFRRNIDNESGEGTAEFIRNAIRIYCKKA